MNIIGEKQNRQKFSRDDLVVLDKNVTVFSVERLQNCSIFEALKILRYKRKYGTDFYHLYWRNIFNNSPKYLQKITIHNRWKNYVLIENIIADYLIRKEINFADNWIYVGSHDWSGYRIIVGCGPAIVLSRFIPENIGRELENTKLYLKRLNINSPKIFSTIDEIEDSIFLDIDDVLNFAEQNSDIKPIFQKKHNLIRYSFKIIIFILASMVFYNSYKIYNQDYHPKNLNNKIKTEKFSVYMSSKNYDELMNLLTNLNDNLNWNKISKFWEQNNIKIHALKLDHNFAKIKTELSLRRIKELKNIENIKIDYITDSSYEKLGSDQIVEAVLWLKLN